jgi:hypothetical protein
MGEDLMNHLINNGSMADGAYTQEQCKTVSKKNRWLMRKKEEARKRRTRIYTYLGCIGLLRRCLGCGWETATPAYGNQRWRPPAPYDA